MSISAKIKGLTRYDNAKDVPLSLDLYKQACDLGMTFWQYLEVIQPTKPGETLTAFERQLQQSGIILHSDADKGLYSSTGEYFFQSDRPGSAILFPVLLQKTALWAKLKQIPDINKIVATTRTIAGSSSYQSLLINDSEITGASASGRRFRVNARGEFPTVKIGWSETANAVTKHGVKLDWTYEFVRRASIELMTTVVSRIMIQDQVELFNEAISIAISGDGTLANPAATVKKFRTTGAAGPNDIILDVATAAKVISYEGYLKWISGFQPYTPNVVVGSVATLIKLILMAKPNVDPLAIITSLQEAKSQGTAAMDPSLQQLFPNVQLYPSTSVPDDMLLGIDTQFALERVIELGSDITEVERVIKNQTEAMVISISDNVSKIFKDAVQVLDFTAATQTA